MKKYLSITKLILTTRLAAEISFRLNFLMEIVGSFCFVGLYIAVIVLLMQQVTFGSWTINEMWLLLGIFLILCYAVFYFFWRGMFTLVRNIRNGQLDFYLTKPIDSQFFVSFLGGGTHNLLAAIFGIFLSVWAIQNLGLNVNLIQVFFVAVTLIAGTLDFYSLLLFLASLNFHFGYLGEAPFQIFEFQNFSRYPMEAFRNLPSVFLVFVIPFSALTTIPTMVIINHDFPIFEVSLFLLLSFLLIAGVRKFWFWELRRYASAS